MHSGGRRTISLLLLCLTLSGCASGQLQGSSVPVATDEESDILLERDITVTSSAAMTESVPTPTPTETPAPTVEPADSWE